MSLIPFTVTVIDHVNNPNNTLANTAIEIRTTQAGEPLAQIYSDDAGLIPIPQPGAQTNNLGVFYFYADSEGGFDYKAISSGFSEIINAVSHNKTTNRNPGDGSAHNANDINFSGGNGLIKSQVNIGDSTLTNSVDPMVNVNRNVDNSITGNGHCFSDSSTVNRSGGIAYACYDARVIVEGSDNYNHIAPFQNGVHYKSTGSISNAYGYVDSIIVTDTQIGERTGVKVLNPNMQGAASIGTNVGVRIAEQTAGTQNFSVYTDGATPSYFGGKVTAFGGLQTSGILTIAGTNNSKIDLNPTAGLRFEANVGSSYGWALMTNGYSAYVITNTVGTPHVKFWGNVSFNGKNPATPPTLPVAATDLATAISLANSMRTLLINVGLAN